MSNKIQIKRGLKSNLPVLDAGEPAFTTDTKEFFVGDGKSNIEFAKQEDLEVINNQVSDLNFQTAGGTGTSITLKINQTMTNGLAVTFIASTNNSGAATTINGKPIYKPNTKTVPNLIAGKAYTVWYNSTSDCFFIKASAEGNTIADHVLAGDTFSNDSDTGMVGNMTNRAGAKFQVCGYEGITECIPHPLDPGGQGLVTGQNLYGATGYIDGNSQVQMSVAGLVPENIKSGVKIGKNSGTGTQIMTGTFTSDATAGSAQILNGYSAYVNGQKVNGQATLQSLGGYKKITGTVYVDGQTNGGYYKLTIPNIDITPTCGIVLYQTTEGQFATFFSTDVKYQVSFYYGTNSGGSASPVAFSEYGFSYGSLTVSTKYRVYSSTATTYVIYGQ